MDRNPSEHVLLCGLPGSGKTTVGAALARRWGRPFIDLDEVIARRTGKSIPALFAEHGEPGFREIEQHFFEQMNGLVQASVVATGGGTLGSPDALATANQLGRLVWLSVPTDVASVRLGEKGGGRPLLEAGAPSTTLSALLNTRMRRYGQAARIVDAQGDAETVAVRVDAALAHQEVVHTVRSAAGDYPVRLFFGAENLLALEITAFVTASPVVVVVDRQLIAQARILAQQLRQFGYVARVLAVSGGEQLKQLSAIETMVARLAHAQVDRNGLIVALGGGTITDAVGFVAATYLRGIRWLSVPTTLLGMVDSAIGGKVGANLGEMKNMLGAFYPPVAVLSDWRWSTTLPELEVRSGSAEMIKVGATHDPALLSEIAVLGSDWRHERGLALVARAAAIKAAVVSADEFEHDLRRVLNFGHTFGHAFESAAQLSGLRHGEAVALGMLAVTEFALARGMTKPEVLMQLKGAIKSVGLPVDWRPYALKAVPFLGQDKKRTAGMVKLVTVPHLGQFAWFEASLESLQNFLTEAATRPAREPGEPL